MGDQFPNDSGSLPDKDNKDADYIPIISAAKSEIFSFDRKVVGV